jgi:SAM-dependent methyltransferase
MYMFYYFKLVARFFLVMIRYPSAGFSFMLRPLELFPGFKRSIQYQQDRYQIKQNLKKKKQSIGHALGDRQVTCLFFGREILNFTLQEGSIATADQFFLNRSIDDAKHIIAMASQFVKIRPGDTVFDPGCGAGRHLFYFVDKYQCLAVGVDVYQPAIDVAEVANWDRRVRFYADSSIKAGLIEMILPSGCDFIFINSWLNHVKDYPGYREFATKIVEICRFLLVITSGKDDLNVLFESPDILIQDFLDGAQFALIRGSRARQ